MRGRVGRHGVCRREWVELRTEGAVKQKFGTVTSGALSPSPAKKPKDSAPGEADSDSGDS